MHSSRVPARFNCSFLAEAPAAVIPKSSEDITEHHLPATGEMAKLFAKAGTGGQTQSSCCLSALKLKRSEFGVFAQFWTWIFLFYLQHRHHSHCFYVFVPPRQSDQKLKRNVLRSLTQGHVCERSWAAECRYRPRQGRNSEPTGSQFLNGTPEDPNQQSHQSNGSNVSSSKRSIQIGSFVLFSEASYISSWKC